MARRRRHPQTHTSEQGAGMARRRRHPQIQPSADVAGATRRRSPRVHPQIHAIEEVGAGMARRIRRRRTVTSPAAADASLPDDDDMLREILIRLPPQPSSLPRASAVCKRWRGIVTDPRFHRQFSAHHGKPPLLGVFERNFRDGHPFRSILDPPDRIPPERFYLRHQADWGADLLGCRHGRVLLMDFSRLKVTVCNPITSERHHIEVPPEFRGLQIHGDVLCAATDQGHVHGNCHSSPYKVVLMSVCKSINEDEDEAPPIACVYSSETSTWGNIISTTDRCGLGDTNPGVLVGNVLYWSSKSVSSGVITLDLEEFIDDIIEFDLDRQNLAVIKGPPCLNDSIRHQIIQAENGALGLAMLSHGRFEMWQRKVDWHGAASWFLHKTVEMHTYLGLPPQVVGWMSEVGILGYDENNGAIFVNLGTNVYMVQLTSMQSRKLYESDYAYNCYPCTSFYAPVYAVECGRDGAEMLSIVWSKVLLRRNSLGGEGLTIPSMAGSVLCDLK